MNAGIWGGLSALSLGTADFLARFTARGMGKESTLFGVLALGVVLLTGISVLSHQTFAFTASSLWLLAVNGVSTTVMTLLLYQGLARGPVTVVAPIVASYPALIVIFDLAMGDIPTPSQWLGMGLTIFGALVVGRFAGGEPRAATPGSREIRVTIAISIAAAVAYAILVMSGQAAIRTCGEIQALWLGRVISLLALCALLAARRMRPAIPLRWWPALSLQGLLDMGGYLLLLFGSAGEGARIAAVVGSSFGAVTTLLGWLVLRETIGAIQWAGIASVFAGVAILSW
jgi:drug/metabolite transporter (DMT)-like permease